jgi:hypothetical protein
MTRYERRRFKRIVALFELEERVIVTTETEEFPANLCNLGLGGALLDLGDFEIKGCDSVSLYFENGGALFSVRALPARQEGRKVAFEFLGVTPQNLRDLQNKLVRMKMLADRLNADRKAKAAAAGQRECLDACASLDLRSIGSRF